MLRVLSFGYCFFNERLWTNFRGNFGFEFEAAWNLLKNFGKFLLHCIRNYQKFLLLKNIDFRNSFKKFPAQSLHQKITIKYLHSNQSFSNITKHKKLQNESYKMINKIPPHNL
jgi:hypothetical protein